MVLTHEEMIGKDQLIEYMYINRTTLDIQDSQTAVLNIFYTLIQYPSIMSKHVLFRTAVQSKINEFIEVPELPQHVIDILQQVQLLLNNLPQRIDYIE